MGKEVMDIAFFVIQLFNGLLQLFLTIFTGLQGKINELRTVPDLIG